jgi:chaperonin GroEL (HSP60 family)
MPLEVAHEISRLSPIHQRNPPGFCASIHTQEVGSHKVVVFRQSMQETGVATILVRGSTQNILNDIERAIDDGVNVVRAMGRDARFVFLGHLFCSNPYISRSTGPIVMIIDEQYFIRPASS